MNRTQQRIRRRPLQILSLMFMVAPLPVAGGTGSPINPLALF